MKRHIRQLMVSGLAVSLVAVMAGCSDVAEEDTQQDSVDLEAEDLPDPGEQEPVLDDEEESE